MPHEFHYGGQALIEGVMMRGQKGIAMGVRRPNGEISLTTQPLSGIYTGYTRRAPLVRGVAVLLETLILGTRCLLYSANVSLEEEEVEIGGVTVWGMLAITFAFAVALFFMAPLFLTRLTDPYISSSLVSNIVEGVIRIVIFILYLAAINLMPDIKRVWAYHGAEHKTINAYESGVPLEVEEVRKFSTAHTRCGTGFILVVLVLAILVFALLGRPEMWLRVSSRIILIPVIAALGYEIIQVGAAHSGNKIVRALLAPGLALQSMTTSEPDKGQLEVAISALKKTIEVDQE